MADEARSRLGRGLASLIGDVGGEAAHVDRPRNNRKVPIEYLKPNPRNPRRAFSEAPSYGKPVLVYDLKCVGSEAYLKLATEVIQRERELRAH